MGSTWRRGGHMGKAGASSRRGAILVGASTGMGAALAGILAGRGYRLALIARQADKLQQVCDALHARQPAAPGGAIALPYAHDVTQYDEAPELFARIRPGLGAAGSGPRPLVFCARGMPRGSN